jgi:hypothetical protein
MRYVVFWLLAVTLPQSLTQAQAHGFVITPVESSIKFHAKSSVTIAGKFDK